jgi:hypothetical protein
LLSEGANFFGDGDFVLERGRGEESHLPIIGCRLLPRLANEGFRSNSMRVSRSRSFCRRQKMGQKSMTARRLLVRRPASAS